MSEIKQSDFERFYIYLNDKGLVTVQLTNEPMQDAIRKTVEAMHAYAAKREQAARINEVERFLEEYDGEDTARYMMTDRLAQLRQEGRGE